MRRSLSSVLAMTLSLGSLHAQTAPSAPVPPPPPPAVGAVAAPVQLSGMISRLLINPNGDVDGLLLQDGTQVPVPPPLSSTLLAALHVGDTVRVTGVRMGNLPLIAQAQVTGPSGAVIVGVNPPPPVPPGAAPALVPLIANGTVERPLYGPAGDVTGVLMRDGTVLRLPRPAADRMQAWLQPGAALSARGFGVESRLGRSIQVTSIGRDARSEIDVSSLPPPPGPPPQL